MITEITRDKRLDNSGASRSHTLSSCRERGIREGHAKVGRATDQRILDISTDGMLYDEVCSSCMKHTTERPRD